MRKQKVLYVCHNHPMLFPGGVECYALQLYEAIHDTEEFEPLLLARIGPTENGKRRPHLGTPFSALNQDPNQYFCFTETAQFDLFCMTSRDKELYTRHFHEFLLVHRPDVIHFQHTFFLGCEMIRQARNTLPNVPILYTLHEFLPICHRQGQMLRTQGQERCREASPRRCHECFPDISRQDFFLRKRFLQSHFELVDLFTVPSPFARELFVAWGLPPEKVRYETYPRPPVRLLPDGPDERPKNRFAFFGQFNPFKGLDVLLKAMKLIGDKDAAQRGERAAARPAGPGIHLWLHGANLEMHPEAFQIEFRALLDAVKDKVTLVGRYSHEELASLLANIDWVVVPSIWWETGPLVILEAFQHGRPVICSDIGAMAEKVADGVNGLHFRAGDPVSLANAIRRAAETPGLWQTLRGGIPQVYPMADHVAVLTRMYRELLDARQTPSNQLVGECEAA
jgi:glycosyltransferase involved in cell wall biosynthesis